MREPAALRLDIRFDDSRLRTVEAPPAGAADLGNAGVAAHAATQSAASMPGYSPAAGLAGVVIGLGIAKSLENSSLRKKANEPFESLRAEYAMHWQELGLRESLLHEWEAHGSPELPRCSADEVKQCARLILRPTLLLLSGGQVLSISIDATLQDRKGRSMYASKVRFASRPVTVSEIADINEYWSRDNLRSIAQEWSAAVTALVPLLQIEIQRHEKPGKELAQAIRFENAAGLFYDRGVILSQDAHQIVYRSLDDSITVAYMDRLITTEEYYEWLARKPSPPSAQ